MPDYFTDNRGIEVSRCGSTAGWCLYRTFEDEAPADWTCALYVQGYSEDKMRYSYPILIMINILSLFQVWIWNPAISSSMHEQNSRT